MSTILDNYGTHKTPLIQRWLLRHPRFHLHFTPTYASWINQVEHYQAARSHQGPDQRTPSGQCAVTPLTVGRNVRHDRPGGLIHEYDRAAA